MVSNVKVNLKILSILFCLCSVFVYFYESIIFLFILFSSLFYALLDYKEIFFF